MKKNLLLVALLVGISVTSQAQITVWEDDFNDNDVTDWTLLDMDGNTSNWQASGNLQMGDDGSIYFGTEYAVLSSYNINMQDGQNLPEKENNWAISPAIDLSFYTGTTELIINAQTAIYDGSQDILIYASKSPEQASFELVETVNIVRAPGGSTDVQFNDYTVDISEYVGETQVYIALVTKVTAMIGYEIDNIKINAEEIAAGLDDLAGKTASKIKQNPVAETLQLQLGNTVNADNLSLEVYNVNGMLVKEVKYNEAGISVNGLSGGVYFLALKDGNAVERLKFIKK